MQHTRNAPHKYASGSMSFDMLLTPSRVTGRSSRAARWGAKVPRYRCYFLAGESIKAAENIESFGRRRCVVGSRETHAEKRRPRHRGVAGEELYRSPFHSAGSQGHLRRKEQLSPDSSRG